MTEYTLLLFCKGCNTRQNFLLYSKFAVCLVCGHEAKEKDFKSLEKKAKEEYEEELKRNCPVFNIKIS